MKMRDNSREEKAIVYRKIPHIAGKIANKTLTQLEMEGVFIFPESAKDADIVIFGEAFLQGFYGATFEVEHDNRLAISQEDSIIKEICSVSKEYGVAVSFGFIEKEDDLFYSSQITIDSKGEVIDVYRRVSPGWKEEFANEKYCEGKDFQAFEFIGQRIVVGLCGDLWFDDNVMKIKSLSPDVVLWPVYTDFNCNEWNESMKYEYAEQAGKVGGKVLYVNSYCKDNVYF